MRRDATAEQVVDNIVNNRTQLRSKYEQRKLLGVIRTCWLVAVTTTNKAARSAVHGASPAHIATVSKMLVDRQPRHFTAVCLVG